MKYTLGNENITIFIYHNIRLLLQKRIVFCENYVIVWARAWLQQKDELFSSPTERERRNRPVVSGCLPWNEKLSTASISKGGNSLLFLSTGGGNVWLTQHILLSCFGLPWNVWNSCGIPCRTKKAELLQSSHSRITQNKCRPFKGCRETYSVSLYSILMRLSSFTNIVCRKKY